jgi:phosphate transport system permease protein
MIMILPTIAAISREVISAVPQELREGMFALGATHWEVISRVVLPVSKTGISGALLLALGRAIGEAMAVTMVIGNANVIPSSLLAPAQTAASQIVNEFPEALGLHLSSLLLLGLLLFIITLLINLVAVLLVYRTKRWSVGVSQTGKIKKKVGL